MRFLVSLLFIWFIGTSFKEGFEIVKCNHCFKWHWLNLNVMHLEMQSYTHCWNNYNLMSKNAQLLNLAQF